MLGVHRNLSRKADLMLLGALDLFETHRHYEGRRAVLTGLRSVRLAPAGGTRICHGEGWRVQGERPGQRFQCGLRARWNEWAQQT